MPLRYLLLSLALLGNCYLTGAATCYNQKFTSADWPYCFSPTSNILVYSGKSTDGNFMRLGMLVSGHTTGWSALAIAGNGGMKGAREIVVRQTGGAWMAEDRYSTDYTMPALSGTQNVKLMFAMVENGNTLWGVLLPMNACTGTMNNFPTNYPLDEDFNRWLLWAFGSSHSFAYHGQTNRGSFQANIYSGPQAAPSLAGAQEYSMTMPGANIILTGADPTNPYICGMKDFQQVFPGKNLNDKHHAVRFEVVLDSNTQQYVHHIILLTCSSSSSAFTHNQIITNCASMPSGCDTLLWGWARGSTPVVMPATVGLPVGQGNRWLALQMHYYNPSQTPNLVDSSGVKISLVPTLRSVDAASWIMNGGTSPSMRNGLSAGQQHVTIQHNIPSQCTNFNVPGDQINVITVAYHEHLVGTHVNAEVIRGGSVIGVLRRENQFDFNHQALTEGPVKTIHKGDQFKMTCSYNTQSRATTTEFGEASQNEMCWMVAFVYPNPHVGSINYQKQSSGPPKTCCQVGGTSGWGCYDVTPSTLSQACQVKGDVTSAAATATINQCSSCSANGTVFFTPTTTVPNPATSAVSALVPMPWLCIVVIFHVWCNPSA